MSPGKFRVVRIVAAADDAGGGDVVGSALFDDVKVAVVEALVGELQMPQSIIAMHIDAGVVDDEVGFDLL